MTPDRNSVFAENGLAAGRPSANNEGGGARVYRDPELNPDKWPAIRKAVRGRCGRVDNRTGWRAVEGEAKRQPTPQSIHRRFKPRYVRLVLTLVRLAA